MKHSSEIVNRPKLRRLKIFALFFPLTGVPVIMADTIDKGFRRFLDDYIQTETQISMLRMSDNNSKSSR